MKPTRVEIGRLVVRSGGRLSHVEGAALSRLVAANLKQLFSRGDGPSKSWATHAVHVHAGPPPHGSNVAGAVAQALYRSIRGKI
jgi:hypothetical protein